MRTYNKVLVSLLSLAVLGAGLATSAHADCKQSTSKKDKKMQTLTKDIVDTAVSNGNFNTLVAAVKAAGLVETLQGPGPFTVFAPTDEAFKKIPAADLEALLANKEKLTAILTYHVLPGTVKAADVADGKAVKTVQGTEVHFKVADGKVKIDDATITATDIMTKNGVIHVIDTVITPKN